MYHNSITNSSFVPRHFSTPPRNMAPRRNPALPAVPETPTHSFVVQEPRFEDDPQDVEEVSEPAQDSTATLVEAIALMTAELRHREPKKTNFKSNKPDTFDGSDPKKLNNFVLLCGLHFRSNPSSFDDDGAKVTFALSYLRGTALEFFEPSMLDPPEDCNWLEDWSAFVRTLRKYFGPIDPAADAEDSLDNLKMGENQRILKYNVEFNRLSILTGWKGPILKHRYYTGLAERIKDVIGQQGKPADLAELKSVAHAIDARHWERLREKTRNDSKTPHGLHFRFLLLFLRFFLLLFLRFFLGLLLPRFSLRLRLRFLFLLHLFQLRQFRCLRFRPHLLLFRSLSLGFNPGVPGGDEGLFLFSGGHCVLHVVVGGWASFPVVWRLGV